MNVDRLLRRKARLTRRIIRRDQRWLDREADRVERGRAPRVDPETGLPLIPERTILRAAIWKVDVALEKAGVFDA